MAFGGRVAALASLLDARGNSPPTEVRWRLSTGRSFPPQPLNTLRNTAALATRGSRFKRGRVLIPGRNPSRAAIIDGEILRVPCRSSLFQPRQFAVEANQLLVRRTAQ
jgi:hypothetical protein